MADSDNITPAKTCTKCRETKPLEMFGKDPRYQFGVKNWCKACCSAYQRERAKSQPEKIRERNRRYREQNREKVREWGRRYKPKPEQRAARHRRYKERHPDKVRERNRKYSLTPQAKAARRERHRKNADSERARARAWKANNREHVNAYQNKRRALTGCHADSEALRRARKRATQVVPIRRTDIMARDGNLCYLCGRELTLQTATIDHVIPLSRGGSHTPDNVKLACKPCNSRKQSKLLSELPDSRPLLHSGKQV